LPPPRRALSLGVIALTLALAYGVWYSYSVVLVALLREFGWSRSVLAGAFSVFTLVHGAVNPVVGALGDRLRPMRLMAAGGVALGLQGESSGSQQNFKTCVAHPVELSCSLGIWPDIGTRRRWIIRWERK
jgi:MFS family permease